MARLIRTTTGKPKSRVDVLESWTDTALDANRFPHHTAECNIITTESLCIPFPELSRRLQFAQSRIRRPNTKKAILATTMKMERVDLNHDGERCMFDELCAKIDIRKDCQESTTLEDVEVRTRLEM